jgi:hypothetical protein
LKRPRDLQSSMERRLAYAAGFVVVTLFLLGCSDSQAPVQPTPPLVAPTLQEFRLSGEVYDIAGRPLGGSKVEAINGPRAGTITMTDEAGRFSMPGTFTGAVSVTVSKDDYAPATKTFSQSTSHNFSLEPLTPSANIGGVYTLTLTTDSSCTNLSDEVRTRTYTATIVPGSRPSYFLARLSDAQFYSCPTGPLESCAHNRFGIGMVGDYAGIYVRITEQLGETTYLMVEAVAGGSFGQTGITTPLQGSVVACPSEPALIDQGTWACLASAAVQCDSHNHVLTLVRR